MIVASNAVAGRVLDRRGHNGQVFVERGRAVVEIDDGDVPGGRGGNRGRSLAKNAVAGERGTAWP